MASSHVKPLALLLLSLVVGSRGLLAQDKGAFFPKDFAKDPMQQSDEASAERRRAEQERNRAKRDATPTALSTPSAKSDPIAQKALESLRDAALTQKGIPSGEATVDALKEKGKQPELVKVTAVGAIFVALNAGEFQSRLRDLVDIASKYDLDVGKIYALGDLRLVYDAENIIPLVARGATVGVVDELPEQYASVKQLPTWILETDKGQVVLEGFTSIARFLTAKGEFVDNPEW